jgi:hypothetical protein
MTIGMKTGRSALLASADSYQKQIDYREVSDDARTASGVW